MFGVDLEAEGLCQVVAVGALEAGVPGGLVLPAWVAGLVVASSCSSASTASSTLPIVHLVDRGIVHATVSIILRYVSFCFLVSLVRPR